jgi:hypothetical protein
MIFGKRCILTFTCLLRVHSVHRNHRSCSQSHRGIELLREETYHTYDIDKYPFLDCIRDIFAVTLDAEVVSIPKLSELHCHPRCIHTEDGSKNSINNIQLQWNSNRNADSLRSIQFQRFFLVYNEFVKDVVGPIIGGGKIIYQRAPGLRVSPPSLKEVGKLHNDFDYHHQPSELNFWLPLTPCFENNSLWIESKENLGDWHPFHLNYGEFAKFYGNKCRHFTRPNNTNATRVSIDFRCVSDSSGGHDPDFHRGFRRGPKANFQNAFDIGGFYDYCISPSNDGVA